MCKLLRCLHTCRCTSFGVPGLQVVVDSDMTAKALLSNGQLRNRVTIIPLNKVCTNLTCVLIVDGHEMHLKKELTHAFTVRRLYAVTSELID